MAEVLSLLRELVRRPSVTPDDAGCLDVVAGRLAARGFAVERIDAEPVRNLWAVHGDGGPTFCLAGHVDVVPPGPEGSWAHPPFSAVEEGGFLWGRGAQDMKAGVAALVVAAERLARKGHPGRVAVLLTSDEEGSAVDGTRLVLEHKGGEIDAALVGEPTSSNRFGDKVKVGRRGSASFRLRATGKQGHTAYPHLADNAAHRLVRVLERIVALDWGGDTADFPATTLQVTHLGTSTSVGNVIPGAAEAAMNLRYGTNWTAERIEERLSGCLEPGVEIVHRETSILPFLTQDARLLEAVEGAVVTALGSPPARSTDGGTSDARFFAAKGIPVVEFCPRNDTIHAIDERVEIASLEPLAAIYADTVRRFFS